MDINKQDQSVIVHEEALCPICSSESRVLYRDLQDKMFGSTGEWTIVNCRNSGCGALWLNPAPDIDQLYKLYSNYYTHTDKKKQSFKTLRYFDNYCKSGYLAGRYGFLQNKTSLIQQLFGLILYVRPIAREYISYGFSHLAKQKKGELLEIGCGSGEQLIQMQQWGWQVHGIDFDPNAVNNARAKGLHVDEGDIYSQNFASNSFDAIFCSHVLEHLPNPVAFIKECMRILRPQGVLIVITPNSRSLLHQWFTLDWRGLEPPRHLQILSDVAMKSLVEQSGVKQYTITTSSRDSMHMYRFSQQIYVTRANMQLSLFSNMFTKIVSVSYALLCKPLHLISSRFGEEVVLHAYKER